jgi:glycerol-3-phosphate dehydrogenase subunit B
MTTQASYDIIVVGAGLAGMFAGALAARRGARTLVVARGVGGTHTGPGTIDVWGYDGARRLAENPEAELPPPWPRLRAVRRKAQHEQGRDTPPLGEYPHPLALAGLPALREALAEFQNICEAAGYPLAGACDRNYFLPTALGAIRPTCLAPESFVAGDVRRPGDLALARLPGFRDFFADLAAANLRAAGCPACAVTLDLPHAPTRRDSFATDLARLFDDGNYRAEVANRWRDSLKGVARLGLPAILGLENAAAAHRDLRDKLGVELFEIPILPPSVPGMRLFNVLRDAILEAGGRVTIGPRVTGWVESSGGDSRRGRAALARRATGVIAETAGGPRKYAAHSVILATGGFRHGGLDAPVKGQVKESVFDLPVVTGDQWFTPLYWDAHPYARFGVRVKAEGMLPVDANEKVIYPNLFAVGGLLVGADRTSEGSREGIDLATAWKAVEQIPNPKSQVPTSNL